MNCAYRAQPPQTNSLLSSFTRSRLVLLGLACLALLSSGNAVNAKQRAMVRTQVFRLGREFNLKQGNGATLAGDALRIKFAQVTEDSRCPQDVECVWAGNATLQLEATLRGRDKRELLLNTNGKPTLIREVRYRGYKVTLVRLQPYPISTRPIAKGDYVVTLKVSKN